MTEILEIMKRRHSVRQYKPQPIEPEKRSILDALTAEINRAENLHIQMVYDEPKCFDAFMARYGKFTGVGNYIALVGKKSPKLDETLGYYGAQLDLKAQKLGLSTCWVAMSHGKSKAVTRSGEKSVCLIALGYGCTQGVPHKSKPIQTVCSGADPLPTWFLDGINAALLAPTAMNQQKFHFDLRPDGTVSARCDKGFYTKLDLGIVKYHFEILSGRKTI